jgi:poly(3-hydroxybutyrate) depolymerase
MIPARSVTPNELNAISVPFLWPMVAAAQMAKQGFDLYASNLAFIAEEQKIHHDLRPRLAIANHVMLDLHTMLFRDYSAPAAKGLPTVVDTPYAGHTAMIADFQKGQSLIETLLANDLDRVFLTDWKPAIQEMKDLGIDEYLAEINVVVDDVGGRVNLIGLCQGGWMSAMYAARIPHKVATLVLAGAPIDANAGDGPVKHMAHEYPTAFYEGLVAMGDGLMLGKIMLQGWKGMHPMHALYSGTYRPLRTHR